MTTTPAHPSATPAATPTKLHARERDAAIAPLPVEIRLGVAEIDAVKEAIEIHDDDDEDEVDDDTDAMLDILDMDLDMSIPEVAGSIGHAMDDHDHTQTTDALAAHLDDVNPITSTTNSMNNTSTSSNVNSNASTSAMKSQTCVTFLHIMKEFSESSCNAKEMVQRVDSLVHQDEQLLKLLPLTKEDAQADRRLQATASNKAQQQEQVMRTSAAHLPMQDDNECINMNKSGVRSKSNTQQLQQQCEAMDVDEIVFAEDPVDSRISSPRSVDLQRTAGLLGKVASSELLVMGSDNKNRSSLKSPRSDDDEGGDDQQARVAKRQRENDKEMGDAHDELQRWIDLDLELDHRMDVFDFTKDQAHGHLGATPPASTTTAVLTASSSLPAQSSMVSPFLRQASSSYLSSSYNNSNNTSKAASQASGFLRGNASAVSRDMASKRSFLGSPWHKVTAAPFDKKSVTAALFGDDDGDDDDDSNHSVIDTMARAKLLANANNGAARGAAAAAAAAAAATSTSERQQEGETKCDDENVWGMEDDEYQQDLLSSIDHSVLCDRENRFLQWDLEMEAQQQQQQQQMNTPPSSSSSSSFGSFPPAGTSSQQNGDRSKYKWLMASSPREKIARSPSNVDIVEDWNSLDFGTFQNRTVSHILSSCLNKRKLHHPYKNQVKLVNFNVSGDAVIEPVAPTQHASHALGGSLATSLAFGGQAEDGRGMMLTGEMMGVGVGGNSGGGLGGVFGVKDGLSAADMLGKSGLVKGEKKSKKREERKRLMSLKMQETFADLEGTFTEQDLDFKNVAGAGSLSKMALAKLEAMPLPDLSNLPQDLKELKRKIEATEHKVEGTKHRHRKGGPCPRCQVQNQLRAAKRAYHKRAVAHKKLPQSAGSLSMLDSEAADLMFSSPPLTPSASPSSVFDGASPSLSPVSTASSASPVSAAAAPRTAGAPFLPVVLPASAVSAAPTKSTVSTFSTKSTSTPSLMVAVGSATHASVNNALLQHRQQTAAAQLAKNRSLAAAAAAAGIGHNNNNNNNNSLQPANAARSTAAFQAAAQRRPCGNTFASSSSSASSASASPSSPESASPQVHHVTVTSA